MAFFWIDAIGDVTTTSCEPSSDVTWRRVSHKTSASPWRRLGAPQHDTLRSKPSSLARGSHGLNVNLWNGVETPTTVALAVVSSWLGA